MTVDACYSNMRFIMRKNQAGGLKSTDFEKVFNSEQSAYLSDLLGRWQNRGNGKSGLNTGLVENETILTKLAPFTLNATLSVVAGVGAKPAGFVYELAMRINDKQVQSLPKSQLAAMLGSVIDPPSADADCYYKTEYGANYKFYPTTVASASLDYIKRPLEVVWGFTYDADDRQVYNPAASVDPQWLDEDCIEIVRRCMKTLGVSFKDSELIGMGNSVIQTGD